MTVIEYMSTIVWPLCFLLVALFIIRRVGEDLNPIVKGVVGGVTKNAAQHALGYAMIAVLAVLSSLEAIREVAQQFHWVAVEAGAKVLMAPLTTIVAYVIKPPSFTQAAPDPKPPEKVSIPSTSL